MAQARDLLDRLRPAGSPGAAAGAAVPADHARELAAELQPVLAMLDGVHADCERIIREARREASRITDEAQARAAQITQEAERRARATSDEAASRALTEATARSRRATAAARRRAAAARKLGRHRMPELVAAAVELARSGPSGSVP